MIALRSAREAELDEDELMVPAMSTSQEIAEKSDHKRRNTRSMELLLI
jgi:hypothetical protein